MSEHAAGDAEHGRARIPDESESSRSVWMETATGPARPRLERDASVDVCVVGAGIAGLSVAYQLAREGQSVLVLDQAVIGAGMTGRTTAHFTNALDDRYFELERIHGRENAALAAESHTRAIQEVEDTVVRERIGCDMHRVDGWLFGAKPADVDVLVRELEAAQRAGLVDVQLVERAPLPFDTGRALRFAGQLELHPVLYLEGLARAIERAGGKVYERTRAVRIEGGKDAHVATAHGPVVRASAIAVATNTPVNDLVAVHTKQASYQTYVIALEVPLDAVPHGLYWDTAEPYHYVRVVRGLRQGVAHEQLIVGGEDHKTGQEEHPEQRWTRLEQWTRARFPRCGAVTQRWSGQVLEPVDGLAFIGKNPLDHDNVHVVTGDSGNGMTHGTIAGLLLRDLIRGRENPWAALYAPNRKSLRSLGRFARENLNVAKEYAQWLGKGDVADASEIARGEGAIVRRGVRPVAVYVDEQGKRHEHSGVCPHLGCIVAWNRAEKSWDCPCHGSRFDPEGRVIHGPSKLDLAPAEELRTERSA